MNWRIRRSGNRELARESRLKPASFMIASLLIVAFASACGSSSNNPGVANITPTPTAAVLPSASPSNSSGMRATGLVAYSTCMRAHGVLNFPDPNSNGAIPKQQVVSAFGAVSSSQRQAAENACSSLLAGGSLSGQASQTITTQQQQDYLKAAACMRSHGIANFPDPTFSDGHVDLHVPSNIDQNSPQFTQAAQICTKLIPAGLPYSRPGA